MMGRARMVTVGWRVSSAWSHDEGTTNHHLPAHGIGSLRHGLRRGRHHLSAELDGSVGGLARIPCREKVSQQATDASLNGSTVNVTSSSSSLS